MDEKHQKEQFMRSQMGENVVPDRINPSRELGIMFQKGDQVRLIHGIVNAKSLKESPRNQRPASMEKDATLGMFGEFLSAVDKSNNWHEKVHSDGYDIILLAKIKWNGMKMINGIMITDEIIEYVMIDSLVNYSLLGDTIANSVYEKSHDRDLPLYKGFHEEEVINQEILDVIDNDFVDRFRSKYTTSQMLLYDNYFEQMEDVVKIRKMYVRDVHKWYAEHP